MDQCTKVGGKITRRMEKVDLFMPTVTSTTACGSTTKLTATASIAISMAPNMKATGLKTSNTVRAWRPGLTEPNMMACMFMVRSMELAVLHGLMEARTMGSLRRIIYRGRALIIGLTEGCS